MYNQHCRLASASYTVGYNLAICMYTLQDISGRDVDRLGLRWQKTGRNRIWIVGHTDHLSVRLEMHILRLYNGRHPIDGFGAGSLLGIS